MLEYTESKKEAEKLMQIADNKIMGISKISEGYNILIAEEHKKEIYFVSDELLKLFRIISKKKHPYSIGFYFGTVDTDFEPSFGALFKFAKISDYHKVVISRKEEMRFLYGRDIRASQIRSFDKELKPGHTVIVCNKSNEAIGLGRVLNPIKPAKRSEIIIKNTMDLGWLLRRKE